MPVAHGFHSRALFRIVRRESHVDSLTSLNREQHAISLRRRLIAALMTGVGVGSWLVGALQASRPLDALYRLSSLYTILVLALAWPALHSSRRTERKRSTPVPA
jgi:hypothetical protein